jgi:hypothetical protein
MRRHSEKPAISWSGPFHHPYILINLILAGIIAGIIGYSALFSPEENKYPVHCTHKLLTGNSCPTCGLSHSFSAMLRFNLEEARQFSSFGPRIFVFFSGQLLLRCMFSLAWVTVPAIRKKLVWTDAALALIFFAWAFAPLLSYMIQLLTL